MKIVYAKARGKGHKIAWYLILLAVLSPILLLLTGVVGSWLTLTANGTVALEQYEIRAPRSGRINRLGVLPGETVAPGVRFGERQVPFFQDSRIKPFTNQS